MNETEIEYSMKLKPFLRLTELRGLMVQLFQVFVPGPCKNADEKR